MNYQMSKITPIIVAILLFLLIIITTSILFIKQPGMEKNEIAVKNTAIAPPIKNAKPGQITNLAPIVKVRPVFDPKNCSYDIENAKIILKDGHSEQEIAPVTGSKEIINYFGNEAQGDLNGDGKDDKIVIITKNAGGTSTFYYVAGALRLDAGCIGTNAILLGDRIAPKNNIIDGNGVVIVNYADRKPEEPMIATPSVDISRYFKIVSGQLMEIKP